MDCGRLKYAAIVLLSTLIGGCGVTRHLPEDRYMLTSNKIRTDKDTPREERVTAGELNKYIPQSPSKKFLGTNLPAWLYLQADPASEKGWDDFLRKAGSEPVLLDTTLAKVGNNNLKLYMNSRGFYESESDYSIKYNDRRRRAKVTYKVKQGEPFRIRNIDYDFRDAFLEQVIRQENTTALVKPGDIFDTNMLRDERERISSLLQNRGYYNFSINNILYKADTTVGDHLADITMVVKQHVAGYDDKGDPVLENSSIYSLRDIYVHPDYDATLAATDPTYNERLDTVEYRGLKIVSLGKSKINPKTLRRTINLYPDYLYSYDEVQQAYNDILRLNYFKSARILFDEVPEAYEGEGYVTFVGDDEGENTAHTSEKQLNCTIMCSPALKQGYTIDFEASTTSAFYGLKASATYTNRNLFRGAELFNIGVSGGYEFYQGEDKNRRNSYEIGAYTSLTFPRFLTPFPVDRANRATRPQTRVELSINKQNRPYYERTISGVNLSYGWSNSKHSSYVLRPIDLNVVKSTVDEDFLNSITNEYLKTSYLPQLVPASSFSYQYNNKSVNKHGNSLLFRANLEVAGNLAQLVASGISDKITKPISADSDIMESYYNIFGVRFAQYYRVDLSISQNIPLLWENASIAYRFMGGIGMAYGNSSALPLDRKFYSGGSTSMRGWQPRTLGPGGSTEKLGIADQTGNMKLEFNVELRFPVWNSLRGALFFDCGNIWNANIKGTGKGDPSVFRFDTFYKQLGLNTGIGLRYDVKIAVIRIDWGIKLHNPNNAAGNRWINRFRLGDTALFFGIGYPF